MRIAEKNNVHLHLFRESTLTVCKAILMPRFILFIGIVRAFKMQIKKAAEHRLFQEIREFPEQS
jgi:hypothetical protein